MAAEVEIDDAGEMRHPLGFLVCGAKARHSGKPCMKPAGWGTEHNGFGTCKLHMGNCPNPIKSAERKMAMTEVRGMFDDIPEVDPRESLLMCVRLAAAQVSYYAWRVSLLTDDNLVSASIKDVATASGKVVQVVTGPSLSIWQDLLDKAIAKLATYSKMALDHNIDERLVNSAERIGDEISRLIRGILDDLMMTDDQMKRAPDIVGRHLAILENAN